MIWEQVPQPVRVISYLPCAECWNSYKLQESLRHETRRRCALDRHPDWKLRYVVQPREQASFHHYMHVTNRVLSGYLDTSVHLGIEPSSEEKDRAKIQHIGLGEISERFSPAVAALEMPLFPRLRALSLLVAGPNGAAGHRWLEMSIISIQQVDCELRNIPESSLLHHLFFGEHRLRNPVSQLGPKIRPLRRYWKLLKALLWHEQHDRAPYNYLVDDPWVEFLDYVLENREECPLEQVKGWEGRKHSKEDMLQWAPSIDLDCKLICEKSVIPVLDTLSVFDADSTGSYKRFFKFKEAQMAQPLIE
ncbi:hypothetical protein N7490_005791 [Penicillium lividum]|nr:hypothetical protein N7490_005791 [Penicillium lividum]